MRAETVMGRRGPAPTPTKLLQLRGSWKGDSRKGEPEPTLGEPSCPTWLDPEAKDEWRRVVPSMLAAGTLAYVDRAVLAGFCQSWADYHRAVKAVQNEGETAETPQGYPMKNPWVTIKNEAWARYNKAAGDLGLSASARTRIQTAPPQVKSGKERFFQKRS